MSKYNVDLMLAVREQITSHPETHDQRDWARRGECGTVCCIAGWAAVLAGEELAWDQEGRYGTDHVARCDRDGEALPIGVVARDLLGLSVGESAALFSGRASQAEALARLDALIEKGKNQP